MITRSAFIYGYTVTDTTNTFYFDELLGNGVISFSIDAKGWSLDKLREKVQEELNALGELTYVVSVDRLSRLFTFTGSGNFSLLPSESAEGSLFDLLGISGDKTGSNEYVSDVATGAIYYPQFPLENYTAFEDDKRAVVGSKTEAPSGAIRGTNFGLKGHMSCDFKFIGDIEHNKKAPVESNPNGLQDARDFLDYCVTYGALDFSYDRNDLDTFTSCVQISNGRNRNGQGYQLKDIKKLYGFKELKNIIFREI